MDRSATLGKNSFLPKTVSTPSGTKVTFPSNVRIISVPSGTNVGGGNIPTIVGNLNHPGITQKIVSAAAGAGATAQVSGNVSFFCHWKSSSL